MANESEATKTAAGELLAFAAERGTDLQPLHTDGAFHRGGPAWRYIVYHKRDCHYSYSLQGRIAIYPRCMAPVSASAFRGGWNEAGSVDDLESAFGLLEAWLIRGVEVDDLPQRAVRRSGI